MLSRCFWFEWTSFEWFMSNPGLHFSSHFYSCSSTDGRDLIAEAPILNTHICGQDTLVSQCKVQQGHILFICLPHPCLPLFLHLHLQCFGRLAQRKLGIRSRTQPYIGLWWHLWNSILLFGRGPIYQPPILGEPSIYIQIFTDFADLRPPGVPYQTFQKIFS